MFLFNTALTARSPIFNCTETGFSYTALQIIIHKIAVSIMKETLHCYINLDTDRLGRNM